MPDEHQDLSSRLSRLLIEPQRPSGDVAVRLQSNLLSFVLLIMIVVFGSFDAYRASAYNDYNVPWAGYGFLVFSYTLNRLGYYAPAAFLASAMFPFVILSNLYWSDGTISFVSVAYLITGLTFASLLLSFRGLLALAALDLAAILVVPYVRPMPAGSTVIGFAVALALAAIFLLTFMYLRNRIERVRRGELLDSMNALKIAEEELRRQERFQERILETSPHITFVFDLVQRRKLFSSRNIAEYLGHNGVADDFSEEFLKTYLHPDDQQALDRLFTRWQHASDRDKFTTEYRLRDSTGKWRWFIGTDAVFSRNQHGQVTQIVGTAQDITHQKELEEKLRHAQKLETLGQLAGGVAHDFNNMLTPIMGYSELMLLDLKPGDANYDELKSIVDAGHKAKAITQQLLSFSRKQILEFRNLNLNTVLKDFSKILRRTIRENVEIKYGLDAYPAIVHADSFQVEQIMMNLAINAQDAMPNGGMLSIETFNMTIDSTQAETMPGITPGSYVCMKIGDSGTGMDAATRDRIFEPFFTTKDAGKGTGLGLATVYGIVKQHNGHINVYSEQGHGTVFRIYLPLAMTDETIQSTAMDETKRTGFGTVLVVEDDEMAREMVCRALKQHGFETLAYASPADCIRDFRANNHKVRLLVTDIIMPGMNGKELFHELQKTDASLRVAYMSGYSDSIISHHGMLEDGVFLIPKPFTISTLIRKVTEALA